MSQFVHVKGLAALQAQLDKLPATLEANVMRGGMRAGGKVLEREIELHVPEVLRSSGKSGELKASVRTTTSSKKGVVSAFVKMGDEKAYWWRWFEFGTAAHDIKPKSRASLFVAGLLREIVHHPGAKPRPVMRSAMDSKAGAALVAVGEYVRNRLAGAKLSTQYGTERTAEDIQDVS